MGPANSYFARLGVGDLTATTIDQISGIKIVSARKVVKRLSMGADSPLDSSGPGLDISTA